MQRQARALGDPTRFAIFQRVASAGEPVKVAPLTAHFGLNHNAVRQHLSKLCEAGLLVEELAVRTGPGRPPLQYRVAAGVPGTWATKGPYEDLALLLLELAATGSSPRDVGRRAGRRAAEVIDRRSGSALAMLSTEMQRRGFEPRVEDGPPPEVVLDHCPYRAAALAEPAVICEIHRGVAEGFLEGIGTGAVVSDLVVSDPERAGCRIRLRGNGSAQP